MDTEVSKGSHCSESRARGFSGAEVSGAEVSGECLRGNLPPISYAEKCQGSLSTSPLAAMFDVTPFIVTTAQTRLSVGLTSGLSQGSL